MTPDAYAKFRTRRELIRISGFLGMMITGLAMNWPSPLTEWYSSEQSNVLMTQEEVSWMVSITAMSSGISSVPFSMLADRFGRKRILLGLGILSFLNYMVIMFTRTIWVLYLAQLLGGSAVGGLTTVIPTYMSEICTPQLRGSFIAQLNAMYFFGLLVIYVIGPILPFSYYILGCSTIPVIFVITFHNAPESPYFLVSRGKDEKAMNIMEKLRGKDALKDLEAASKVDEPKKDSLSEVSLWQALRKKDYLKRMILLQILSSVSQFQGISILSMYVMEFVGGEWVAIEMGIVLVLSSFFAAFIADHFGRRPLLICSLLGSAVSMSFITAYFAYGIRPLLYIGIFGFSFFACVGIGPFMLTLPSELFPTRLRAFANGLTQLTMGLANFISLKMFVNINDSLGIKANFIICIFWSLLGVVTSLFLPETANSVISAD